MTKNKINPKETLILLPGLLSDATVWAHQAHHLQDISNPIIPNLTPCNSLIDVLNLILNNAPERFMLAGHSMGGWIAQEIMRHHPERVTKLCLIDTNADIDTDDTKQRRLAMIQQVEQGQIEHVIDAITHDFVYQESAKLAVKNMFLTNKDAFIHQEKMMLERKTCLNFLPSLHLAPLLIVGKHDHKFYPKMLQIQQTLPQSKLAVIEDSGHMTTMEMPQAVTALMRLWVEYL